MNRFKLFHAVFFVLLLYNGEAKYVKVDTKPKCFHWDANDEFDHHWSSGAKCVNDRSLQTGWQSAPPAPAPAESWPATDAHTPCPSISVPELCGENFTIAFEKGRTFASSTFLRVAQWFECVFVRLQQHLLRSIQLFLEDLRALFSNFFFFDLQREAAKPGEVAMVPAGGGPSLASSLQSGLGLWIQIYQPNIKEQRLYPLQKQSCYQAQSNMTLGWCNDNPWLPHSVLLQNPLCCGSLCKCVF